MNFYVGQKVVCIRTAKGWSGLIPTVEGKTYTVMALHNCPSCNVLSLDLGITNPLSTKAFACFSCDHDYHSDMWVQNSARFRPLSERTAESEAFAENLIKQLETEVETLEWLHK